MAVTTRELSTLPPWPKKSGDHWKSSSTPTTPLPIHPAATPQLILLPSLAAVEVLLRRVPPALPPKLTPTVGLMKPSARAGAAEKSRPVARRTANPYAGFMSVSPVG